MYLSRAQVFERVMFAFIAGANNILLFLTICLAALEEFNLMYCSLHGGI